MNATATAGFDERLHDLLRIMASEGIRNAADGLASMIGATITVADPDARLVPISEIAALAGGPESEAVGIYLQVTGDISGQIMLVMPYPKALELADLLMDEPPGTTTQLGSIERSALAEVGNLTGTFFLNAIAKRLKVDARPSPPAVMVDMVGAVLDIIVAVCGGVGEHVLLMQGQLMRDDRAVDLDFWVIPDPATLAAFAA